MAKTVLRVTLSFGEEEAHLFSKLNEITRIPTAAIAMKVLGAHYAELWEYLTWLESLPADAHRERSLGINLLASYGPDALVAGIKQIDPKYTTMAERMKSDDHRNVLDDILDPAVATGRRQRAKS